MKFEKVQFGANNAKFYFFNQITVNSFRTLTVHINEQKA